MWASHPENENYSTTPAPVLQVHFIPADDTLQSRNIHSLNESIYLSGVLPVTLNVVVTLIMNINKSQIKAVTII